MLKNVLDNKENFVGKSSSLPSTHRYCSNEKSNIFICGGRDTNTFKQKRKVMQFNENNLKNVKHASSMKTCRYFAKSVCLKGDVYIFGGIFAGKNVNYKRITSIEKYSLSSIHVPP